MVCVRALSVVVVLCVVGCHRDSSADKPLAEPAKPVVQQEGEVAVVEPVTDGSRHPFKVVSVPGDASSFEYHVEDATGEKVDVPPEVASQVTGSMYPLLALDDAVVVYDHEGMIKAYVFESREVVELMELSRGIDMMQYGWAHDGIVGVVQRLPSCPAHKSCSSAKVAEPDDYSVSLIVLSQSEQGQFAYKVSGASMFEPMVTCGGVCQVVELEVLSDTMVKYLVRGGPDDPSGEEGEKEYGEVEVFYR